MDFNDCFLWPWVFLDEESISNDCPFASSPNEMRSIRLVSLSRLRRLVELLSEARTVSARLVLNRWRLEKNSAPIKTSGARRRNELHDFLFDRIACDQSVDIHHFLLTDPMGSIHRLQVLTGIPIMFNKDHCVSTGQIQSETTNVGGEQEQIDTRVGIE